MGLLHVVVPVVDEFVQPCDELLRRVEVVHGYEGVIRRDPFHDLSAQDDRNDEILHGGPELLGDVVPADGVLERQIEVVAL